MPNLDFAGAPNDFWLVAVAVTGPISCAVAIGLIYSRVSKNLDDRHNIAAQRGTRVLRILSLIAMALSCVLLPRVTTAAPGDFFERTALNKQWWVAIRVFATCMFAAAAFVFPAHPVFRIYTVIWLPLLASVAMISEVDLASDISCIEDGICADEDNEKSWLYVLAFRELIQCTLLLMCGGFAMWLTTHFGFCVNRVKFPRYEHRQLRAMLADDNL